MSTGVVIGDLLAVADVEAIWANAGEGARATGSVTGKRRGEMAEAKFLAKASELGFGVAKPWGDSDAYDFIVQTGGRLWKVQVKSAHVAWKDGSYSFRAHGHSYKAYRADEIDLLVALRCTGECMVCVSGESDPADEVPETVSGQPEEEVEV